MYIFIFLCYVFAYAARGDHDGNKTISQLMRCLSSVIPVILS